MDLSADKIEAIRKVFVALNRERLERTKLLMRSRQAMLLDLIPLLFHINHPALPGFSGHDCPTGISGWMPDDKLISQARALWRNFELQRQTQWQYDLDALFIMGSCGSIAFSRHSDFDFWLCHRQDLPPEQLSRLQQKATGIELWAAEQSIEVHFFLMNADEFRQGRMSSVSSESSGSAQHRLLLDEFYRTSVWLAGKHPMWWYVPPEQDANYAATASHIRTLKMVSDLDYIDFGPMAELPVNEFFGAAVWQMNKGLDSPYKSVLKITLMEAYANEYPLAVPLAAKFKQKIYQEGSDDATALDPYLMLIDYLEAYLAAHTSEDESLRLEFIRHSFYIKIGLPLSQKVSSRNWRYEEVEKVVQRWGWSESDIELLDNRKQWTIAEILLERKLIVDSLTRSYLFLSSFARQHADDALIDSDDLNILGRKLYSIFEKKPGKIELISRGISGSIQEDKLTYLNAKSKEGQERWLLFKGKVTTSDVKFNRPIKVTMSLVELLAWCFFNRVVGSGTQVLLHAPNVDLGKYDIDAIRSDFSQIAPEADLGAASNEALKKSATLESSLLYVNVGHTPPVVLAAKDRGLISGSHDVLSYGADNSVITQLEWFYINSWKEVHVKVFTGVSGLLYWLVLNINQRMQVQGDDCDVQVRAFSSHLSNIIVNRIEKLYETVCRIFVVERKTNVRYVVESGEKQYVFLVKDGRIKLAKYDTRKELIHSLSTPSASFNETQLDKEALKGTVYSVIFERNRKSVVQVFFMATKTSIAIYVIDEFGSLQERIHRTTDVKQVLSHYSVFIKKYLLDKSGGDFRDRMAFYRLMREKYRFEDSQLDLDLIPGDRAVAGIRASADVVNGKSVITFIVEGKEISSRRYGSKVFLATVKYMQMQGLSISSGQIFIDELQLAAEVVGLDSGANVMLSYHLKYKKLLESKLSVAFSQLTQ